MSRAPRQSYRVQFLKTRPEFFEEILNERKSWEVRMNDRDYRRHDLLVLREWTPENGYSGREISRAVVRVVSLDSIGLKGWVHMDLAGAG